MENYKDCVLILGAFHMTMSFISILVKQFGDAGLRDTLIHAGVLADGSGDWVISGRIYCREIRSYKLAYQAFYTLLLKNLESFYEADAWNQSFVSEPKEELGNVTKNDQYPPSLNTKIPGNFRPTTDCFSTKSLFGKIWADLFGHR